MLTSLMSDIQRQSQEQDLKDRLWHKGSTPIKINVLEKYLAEYNNRGDAELLLSEFKYGFRLQYTGPRIFVWSTNLVSVETHKVETQIKLDISEKPISTLRISPIDLVEKPDNGWRLITDLSYPINLV